MITVLDLWLPILLSAVAVFFLSYIAWMVLPHHRGDWRGLRDEDRLLDDLRERGVGEGQYTFPYASSPKDMANPEWMAKFEQGPSGFLVIRHAGKLRMGRSMATSLLFNLVVSVLVGWVATMGLDRFRPGADVFGLVAVVAALSYSAALGWGPIWFSRTWSSTLREMADGVAYGLVTGMLFMVLWPAA